MKSATRMSALTAVLVASLGLALVGCGGGGDSGTPSAAVALGGTAAAGIFKNADVKVYDATTLDMTKLATAATLVPATTTDVVTGKYSVTLPAGFNKPVLIMVSAKAAGGSFVKDEVFGETPVTNLTLCSVVPTDAITGANLTGHVTPFTNLMCEIVRNKVGRSDVNAAINQARSVVNQLNGNADPLTSDPVTDPAMVSRLAAVSNIARTGSTSDPDGCASKPTNAEKIACTIGTLAGAIAPMASGYDTSSATPAALALTETVRAALNSATDSLDTTVVAGNTGLTKAQLDEKKTAASVALSALQGEASLTPPVSAIADGISQAKQFFANLRTGIWPYANDDQTGFLDMEGDKLQAKVDQLSQFSIDGASGLSQIIGWADDLKDGVMPGACSGSPATSTCWFKGVPRVTMTGVTMTGSGTAWSMANGTLTGSIAFTAGGDQIAVDGYFPPMTDGATKAKVGNPGGTDANATTLRATRTAQAGDMYRYTFEGSIKDLKDCVNNTCTPVIKFELGAGSFATVHEPAVGEGDISKSTASFTGTFITANYRFIGQFGVTSVQAKNVIRTYQWGTDTEQEMVGGTAAFTGTINGTGLTGVDVTPGNDFNLLVGKLEANVDGTNYSPDAADSAANYTAGTLTFTGTVFKSATDPGLKLVMTMSQTGWDKGSMTVSYNDYNKGISVTGSGTYDDQSAVTQYMTLSDGNGISVKIGDDSTTQVMKGTSVLANINGGRVTYVDGTYESLM